MTRLRQIPLDLVAIALFALYPLIPGLGAQADALFKATVGAEFTTLFIIAVLALGLHVVVGYAGQLHLGVAAFFGLGAYVVGILLVPAYPFKLGSQLPAGTGVLVAVVVAFAVAALVSVVTSAPILRLRGDYLALVTLGFGEVARFALRNLEEITNGTKGLNPIPQPDVPGLKGDWSADYRYYYYLCLLALGLVLLLLRNVERSRLGRAWVALREDELAAVCMGLNTARLKLAAFALGAGIAGLAGALYALRLGNTADPDTYSFQRSITVLCCLILGGLGNRAGVLLGVVLVYGFDGIFAPAADRYIQQFKLNPSGSPFLTFSSYRLMVFGFALILIMRFRPEGLLPSSRVKAELHACDPPAPAAPAPTAPTH
ncbi:branched-chain amino acid ABC transporter permease [Gemmata sp. G18]|uniref:Branched-chain amino acid ABC transporter permease n=1 Tax=Gemmata palustris TaxID=2822762 RepID=A0ABS5BVA9_9BACT|nr:branched-chain amino acid ABC transporter permease [Gemmata palustris]MBP3957604.1 branched-chain amino acid ABC transporter permease [Gemmata palustris]